MAENKPNTLLRPPEPRTAPSPFNKPSADIILRTSDHVDFHVYSQILVAASPIFEGMFEVPQPPVDQQDLKDGRPIVEVCEDSGTIETLLRICYPINKPAQSTVQEIEPALRAAMKFEMELAITVLTDKLKLAAYTHPMQVWAAACRLRLEEVAGTAANALVGRSLWSLYPLVTALSFEELGDMEGISAGDYYRLSEFHRRKGQVAPGYKFLSPPATVMQQSQSRGGPQTEGDLFRDFQCSVPNPDIICRSSDGVQFPAHHAVLSAASPSLSERARSIGVPAAGASPPTPTPVLQFDEDASTLGALLRICYNDAFDDMLSADIPQLVHVLIALGRHGLANASTGLLSRWRELLKVAPLRAYCVAIQAGDSVYAKEAARQVLPICLEGEYVAEMESISALSYHRLWTYYRSCERLATDRLQKTLDELSIPPAPAPAPAPATAPSPPLHSAFSFGTQQRNHQTTVPTTSIFGSSSSAFGTSSQSAAPAQVPQSEKTWIRRYIRRMLDDAPTTGPQVPFPPLQELLAKATGQAGSSERVWCKNCQPLAEDLIKADTRYKELVAAMDAIELQT